MLKSLVTLLRIGLFLAASIVLGRLAVSLVPHIGYFAQVQGTTSILLDWCCRLGAVILATIVFALLVDDRSVRVGFAHAPVAGLLSGLLIGVLLVGAPIAYLVSQGYIALGTPVLPDGFWPWVAVVALIAATQTLYAYGYVYSLVRSRHNAPFALIASALVFLGLSWFSGMVPKTPWGIADAAVLAATLALATSAWGGVACPAAIRFTLYLVGGMGLGVVTLPEATPVVVTVTALQPAGAMGALALDQGWLLPIACAAVCLLMVIRLAVRKRHGAGLLDG